MNHLYGDTTVCPVTGKTRTDPFRQCWTVDQPYDACPQCADGFRPVAERLRELDRSRRTAP